MCVCWVPEPGMQSREIREKKRKTKRDKTVARRGGGLGGFDEV